MNYLIHAGLLLAACFLYYRLALRSETNFRLHRWVLLICLVGSLTLPLVTVPAAWSLRAQQISPPVQSTDTGEAQRAQAADVAILPTTGPVAPQTDMKSAPLETGMDRAPASDPVDWRKIVLWAYLAGVAVFALNFLFQFGQLVFRAVRHPGHDLGGFRLVEVGEDAAPYSFWNRIFLNPDRYDEDTYHQIVQHERIHVLQKHSIDLLLAELAVVVQWCNPFAWLYRRAIEHNLEFLTDAEMLKAGNDPERYQLSLVKVAVPNFPNALVTSYNQSFLEQRITMMSNKKSSSRSGWKYLALLPLLLFSVLQFNAVAQSPVPLPFPESQVEFPVPVSVDATVDISTSPLPLPAPTPSAEPRVMIGLDVVPDLDDVPTPLPDVRVDVNTPGPGPAAFGAARNTWSGELTDTEFCVSLSSRGEGNHRWNWQASRCVDRAALGVLPNDAMGDFTLRRAAGVINFRGVFFGLEGAGTFAFEPAAAFENLLRKEGFGDYDHQELLLFFLADMDEVYIDYLRGQGYDPGHKELLEVAIFYDDREDLRRRLTTYESAGFGKLTLREVIELSIHGIDADYISELGGLGYENLTAKEIVAAKIHDVDAAKIEEFRQAGLTNLTLKEAKDLSIHGVDLELVKALARFGFTDLSAQELVQTKIHGINAKKLEEFQASGLPMDNLQVLRNASIHGLTPQYIAGMRKIGYEDLSFQELVQAKIHGITPEWAMSFREVGYRDIPFQTLKQLRIHGVTPAFIKERAKEDRELRDYIKMKIHGL